MAYNNGFPINYQPYQMYAPPQYVQQASQQQTLNQNNGIIWVQGEAGAKSYLVAPNNTVSLWDTESQVIYLKSADASGMPSTKILDYTVRSADDKRVNAIQTPQVEYVTKEEFNAFVEKIQAQQEKTSQKRTVTKND